jgi:hypothetical protein
VSSRSVELHVLLVSSVSVKLDVLLVVSVECVSRIRDHTSVC